MLRKLLVIFSVPALLFARERFIPGNQTPAEQLIQPWFTGPLLASGATTIPLGHVNTQPYFFATKIPDHYNKDWQAKKVPTFWALSTVVPTWIGLSSWMDIEIQPQWSWNHQSLVGGHWAFGDLAVQLDFQLYRDDFPPKNWIPSIKFAIRETCPTGKYRNLDPKKASTDEGGSGSWATSFILVVGRIIHISGWHYLTARINGVYSIFAPVHVVGFNSYGGGYGTNGTVYPKPSFLADLGLEFSLTRNWALALDVVGAWRGGNDFSGKLGELPEGLLEKPLFASNTSPSSIQYSIAPSIEYNFNANLGIVAGPWITLAGKNSNQFYSMVFSLNYYK